MKKIVVLLMVLLLVGGIAFPRLHRESKGPAGQDRILVKWLRTPGSRMNGSRTAAT